MNLQMLGLNTYEGKVYKALIELGKTTGGKIANQSGVPYGRIYDTLSSLQNKKLVSIVPSKTKEFIATNPKEVRELLKQKEDELRKLDKELENLSNIYSQKVKQPVLLGTGKGAFQKLLNEVPYPKKFEYVIKYAVDIKPEYLRDVELNIKKGISTKILVRNSKETESNIKEWKKITKNIKEISNEGVAIAITETHVLISLIKSNSTLLIQDDAFCKIMKDLFKARYNQK